MKKQLLITLFAIVAAVGSVKAQDNMQQKTPNERAKETFTKLKTDLVLVVEQEGKVFQAFEDFYTTMQKLREEMRAAGNTDRERMKDNVQRVTTVREDKLKVILTEAQMKKWVNDIEPAMRPQRRPAGN